MFVIQYLIDWGYVELAEQSLHQVLEALQRTKDHNLTAQGLGYLGYIADVRGDFSQALKNFRRALGLYTAIANRHGTALILFRIGRVHNGLDQFGLARKYFEQCIDVCGKYKITDGLAASKHALAWILQEHEGNDDKALELYEQNIKLAKKTKDFETLISTYRQIGFSLWTKQGEKDKVQKYYDQALQVSKEHSLVKELGAIHAELGFLYDEWGEYDKAEESCRQAIQIFEAIGHNYGLIGAYLNLGKVFETKQDLELAMKWYKESQRISTIVKHPAGQAYACLRLGRALRLQGQYTEAESVLRDAVRLSKKHGLAQTLEYAKDQLPD